MKLRTKTFFIASAAGHSINIEGREVAIIHNGVKLDTKLSEIISALEFDDGEISGNSLLSYYQVQEDGSLQVNGSKIQLVLLPDNEIINIKKIDRPFVNEDEDMPVEHIQKFIEYFNVEDPESVFTDLSAEEKAYLVEKKTAAPPEAQEPDTAAAETAEASNKAKEEEADFKSSINPQFVIEKNKYTSHQSYYREIGFKEYIKEKYHLFYGKDDNEGPNVLIERGEDWMQEVEEVEIVEENDKTVIVELKDKDVSIQIALDIDSGDITVTPNAPSE